MVVKTSQNNIVEGKVSKTERRRQGKNQKGKDRRMVRRNTTRRERRRANPVKQRRKGSREEKGGRESCNNVYATAL